MVSLKHSLRIAPVLGILGIACLVGRSASAQTTTPTHKKYNTGSGTVAWWITQLGLGSAGEYQISNTSNSSDALIVTTNGNGNAGTFTANTGDAVQGYSNGTGGHFVSLGGYDGVNSTSDSTTGIGVHGLSAQGKAVMGESTDGFGVEGISSTSIGVYGFSTSGGTGGRFVSEGGGDGVYSTSDSGFGVEGVSNSSFGVYGFSTSSYGVYGKSSSSYAGYFAGDIYVAGTVHYNALSKNSDARYKQNIRTLPNALDTVLALRGVSYDWRRNEFPQMNFSKTRQIGFIAQEVEKVAPELVSKDRKGMRSLDYTEVVPILVEAIKQQQTQIEALRARNKQLTTLKTQYAALSSRLAHLEQLQQASARFGNEKLARK